MDDITKKALNETAEEFAEVLFSENQMGWQGKRRQFVESFTHTVEDKICNYSWNYMADLGGNAETSAYRRAS